MVKYTPAKPGGLWRVGLGHAGDRSRGPKFVVRRQGGLVPQFHFIIILVITSGWANAREFDEKVKAFASFFILNQSFDYHITCRPGFWSRQMDT